MSFPLDIGPRLLDEQTMGQGSIVSIANKQRSYFQISLYIKFGDSLCCVDARCVVSTIVVKSVVSEFEI